MLGNRANHAGLKDRAWPELEVGGAASSARTFMSPSDRVFWAISAGEMMG